MLELLAPLNAHWRMKKMIPLVQEYFTFRNAGVSIDYNRKDWLAAGCVARHAAHEPGLLRVPVVGLLLRPARGLREGGAGEYGCGEQDRGDELVFDFLHGEKSAIIYMLSPDRKSVWEPKVGRL